MPSNGFLEEKPLSRSEMLAALIIFLVPLFAISEIPGISLPLWIDYLLFILIWGAVLFAIGLAVIKRLPRWSLPSLGFLTAAGFILSHIDYAWTSWIYPIFIKSFGPRSLWSLSVRIIYSGAAALIIILLIMFGALILVSLLRLIPYTRVIWKRIRADWTQLSFLVMAAWCFKSPLHLNNTNMTNSGRLELGYPWLLVRGFMFGPKDKTAHPDLNWRRNRSAVDCRNWHMGVGSPPRLAKQILTDIYARSSVDGHNYCDHRLVLYPPGDDGSCTAELPTILSTA